MKYFIHLPMKMELTEGSETSDIRTQKPGNYPKENILHIEQGESLKSRTCACLTSNSKTQILNLSIEYYCVMLSTDFEVKMYFA